VVEAKDAEVAMLRAELTAERELRRRMELRIAELERRLGQDSTNSGTPTSKEPIAAKERRTAERKRRDSSERERRQDRKPGGQPGHPGAGLARDPDPDQRKTAEPPAQCSRCGTGLAGAQPAGASWAQAVSGYWHTQTTLARWCRIRSYLDSSASHGLTALDAITTALNGKPWLPLPAIEIAA
jgi:Family of unknown function (DUF6444)